MIRGRSWAGWAVHLGGLGSSLGGVAAGIWRRDDRGRERGLNKSGLLGRTGWFQRTVTTNRSIVFSLCAGVLLYGWAVFKGGAFALPNPPGPPRAKS